MFLMLASPLINRALTKAALLHADQKRKHDGVTPFIVHPIGVGLLLSECTDDPEVIAAGILHDTLEDTRYTEKELRRDFGDRVAQLVLAVTEPSRATHSWEERKRAYISQIGSAGREAGMISCADKIDNLRSMMAQYEIEGESMWKKFNPNSFWFYGAVHDILAKADHGPIFVRFSEIFEQAKGLFQNLQKSITPDAAAFQFGTKAETLQRLEVFLKSASIHPLELFTRATWKSKQRSIIDAISHRFGTAPLIVRSSAAGEDKQETSNAGHFSSIGPVRMQNLTQAVEAVFASYGNHDDAEQIFIQKFLERVEMSGVIFTRDKNTNAPYITINYDDVSGETHRITSGSSENAKTLVIHRDFQDRLADKRFEMLRAAIRELEKICDSDRLDIEFCFQKEELVILQVRPIATQIRFSQENHIQISAALQQIEQKISELSQPHPHLYGRETAFGNMPDWNPAEMIGVKPRPLSLSLYKELITDNIWAYQRDNYGYKNLRSFPLMVTFAGQPYIDVRVSFNSFIPKSLNHDLSDKLADYYMNKLKATPKSHDKVEFDIVFSCYTLDLDTRIAQLKKHGFSDAEIDTIKRELKQLTHTIVRPDGLYTQDSLKIKTLEQRRREILSTDLSDIGKIYWLIEDCKRYGTLPFAGLARTAFIATQFLHSLVDLGIISTHDQQCFLGTMNTVAKKLSADTRRLQTGALALPEFLDEYGHLRPGTYDILSESYAENPSRYFSLDAAPIPNEAKTQPFEFTKAQKRAIEKLLTEHGFSITCMEFLQFIREAIEGREYSKFVFTKSVDAALRLIQSFAERFGFSRDDISFVNIHTIMNRYADIAFVDETTVLRQAIEHNREKYSLYQSIQLPHLIRDPKEIYCFSLSEVLPNYISLKQAEADVICVDRTLKNPRLLKNKIVCIASADPGFDWIFSQDIAGLITMYGGANSHMAVRAAELNLPAVIGCGPVHFERFTQARKVQIDCTNQRVTVIV